MVTILETLKGGGVHEGVLEMGSGAALHYSADSWSVERGEDGEPLDPDRMSVQLSRGVERQQHGLRALLGRPPRERHVLYAELRATRARWRFAAAIDEGRRLEGLPELEPQGPLEAATAEGTHLRGLRFGRAGALPALARRGGLGAAR